MYKPVASSVCGGEHGELGAGGGTRTFAFYGVMMIHGKEVSWFTPNT